MKVKENVQRCAIQCNGREAGWHSAYGRCETCGGKKVNPHAGMKPCPTVSAEHPRGSGQEQGDRPYGDTKTRARGGSQSLFFLLKSKPHFQTSGHAENSTVPFDSDLCHWA